MPSSLDIPYRYTDAYRQDQTNAGGGSAPFPQQPIQPRTRSTFGTPDYSTPYDPYTDPATYYASQQQRQFGDQTYNRETASPNYQMGQYQVRQANRSPTQKGTDAGTALRALQSSSGLDLLGLSSGQLGAGGVGGNFPHVAAPDMTAANAAIFARAKDQTGQVGASALRGLNESLAGRGMLGGGLERQGTEQLAQAGAGELGNTIREQAIQEANLGQRNAQLGYQGNIMQRAQDMQERQAELFRNQQARQGLLSVINSSGLLY